MSLECVQVKLELGHKAAVRSKPTAEGFTHDWTVFVRGPEGRNIQHFVEKVSFYLHESFPRPKRVVKEPPYQVSESGYAGFLLPIEVYFKNKEEPKRVRFEYDLFLHVEGPPVNHIRCEKLTFQNPTEDFRRKLIKAGGVGILGPDGGTILGQQSDGGENHGMVIGAPKHSRPSPEPIKKPKSISSNKESSQQMRPTSAPPQQSMTASEPFVALFGQPIKTNKVSPDSRKNKDGSSKTVKSSSGPGRPPSSAMTARKEPKSTSKEAKHKESTKETPASEDTSHKETKANITKRTTNPPPQIVDDTGDSKKRKRLSQPSIPNKGSEKPPSTTTKKKKRVGDEKKTKPEKNRGEKKSSTSSKQTEESSKGSSSSNSRETVLPENTLLKNEPEPDPSPPDTSPESSISFSSLHISGKRGPLGTLMAELDDDEDDELVSPLSSDPPSPPRFSTQPTTPTIVKPIEPSPPRMVEETKPKIEKHKIRHKKSENKTAAMDEDLSNPGMGTTLPPPAVVTPRERSDDSSDLLALHKYLNAMQDRELLQAIADIVEETGRYNITSSTLDFDLRALDKATIRKLQNLLPVT